MHKAWLKSADVVSGLLPIGKHVLASSSFFFFSHGSENVIGKVGQIIFGSIPLSLSILESKNSGSKYNPQTLPCD